jgi:hypothetical protein
MSKVMAASVQDTSPRVLDLIPPFRRHLEAENKAPRTGRLTPKPAAVCMSS